MITTSPATPSSDLRAKRPLAAAGAAIPVPASTLGLRPTAADEAEARGIGETTNLVLFDAAPGATDGGCSTAPERPTASAPGFAPLSGAELETLIAAAVAPERMAAGRGTVGKASVEIDWDVLYFLIPAVALALILFSLS